MTVDGGTAGTETVPIHELRELRDRMRVFSDRTHAGRAVAGMLEGFRGSDALVLAVPAGGVPVGAAVAGALDLPLDVAVVSKITLPWNTEVGYGAVAFDGTVQLNGDLIRQAGLSKDQVRRDIEQTREKVCRRLALLRATGEPPRISRRTAILVDDGLASGFTMRAAVRAVLRAGAKRIIAAVPTGSLRSAEDLAPLVEDLFCANLCRGWTFAVADAYELWTDISERDAREILERFPSQRPLDADPG